MALSGNFSNYPVTVQGSSFGLYCEWSGVQNASGNYTDVTLNVYLRYYAIEVGARSDSTVSINGETEEYTVPAINHYPYKDTYKLIKTKTTRVYHNGDGTKSCKLSASWRMNGVVNGVSIGTITASTTVTLNTIARGSTITSASSINFGDACEVQWTPTSKSFYYKLKFSIGSWAYTTSAIHPNVTSAYTYDDYSIPIDVATQVPNATSGIMTVTLYTYSNSNCTTQIGSASKKTFTVNVPNDIIPTIDSFSVLIDNSENPTIEDWGIYVAGYSKAQLIASASGLYGSSISNFVISGDVYSTTQTGDSLSWTGGKINSSGTKKITIAVKDSRGRISASVDEYIDVCPYSKPSISNFTVARSSSDASKMTAMTVRANWSYSSVNDNNIATATLYYKKAGELNWRPYGVVDRGEDVVLNVPFEETSSYNFRIIVSDLLLSTAQEEAFVSTIEVLLDFRAGGKGLGIGKIAEEDALEVALDAKFSGNVSIQNNLVVDVVVEHGTSGIWTYRKWASGIAECWGTKSAEMAITVEWDGLYVGDSLIEREPYPFTFITRPIETVSLFGETSAVWHYPESADNGINTTSDTGVYRAIRPNSSSARQNVHIDYNVKGRWN